MDYAELSRRVAPVLTRLEGTPGPGPGWEALERHAADHRQVLADFAYARTHFPDSELTARLRRAAFAGHRTLSPRPAPRRGGAWRFFVEDYPRAFREHLPELRAALGVFAGSAALGMAFTLYNPAVAAVWFGTKAVEDVRGGTLWTDGILAAAPPAMLASRILTNNITVGLTCWAGGLLLGAGSALALAVNGMMFGSVLALVSTFDLGDRLFAFIAAHGPLELFLLCVCGAAGLRLGVAQVRPADGSWVEQVAEAGRSSVRLALGSAPWFVGLGLVEGHLSPVMTVPTVVKAGLGALLLAAYLTYVLVPSRARP